MKVGLIAVNRAGNSRNSQLAGPLTESGEFLPAALLDRSRNISLGRDWAYQSLLVKVPEVRDRGFVLRSHWQANHPPAIMTEGNHSVEVFHYQDLVHHLARDWIQYQCLY